MAANPQAAALHGTESVYTWYSPPTRPGAPGLCGPGGEQMCAEVFLDETQSAAGGHPGDPAFQLFHIPKDDEKNNRWPELEAIGRMMNELFAALCRPALEAKQKTRGFEDAKIMLFARNKGLQLVFGKEEEAGHGKSIDLEKNIKAIKELVLENVSKPLEASRALSQLPKGTGQK